MAEGDMSIGEIGRTVKRIEENMVTRDANAEVIRGLREADTRNAGAILDLTTKFDLAEKAIKSAGSARVNIWIAAGIAILGSIAVKFWPGG